MWARFSFGIGLFAICTRGYNLFTGKACNLFDNKPSYLITLAVIWVGNLVGTCLLAFIENLTSLCGPDAGINVTAKAMVDAKLSSGLGSIFLLACICNIFIYLAVNGYAKNPHQLGKYLAIFLGVFYFHSLWHRALHCGYVLLGGIRHPHQPPRKELSLSDRDFPGQCGRRCAVPPGRKAYGKLTAE